MARSRLGYSPALDGVRGVFMLCFMAFHFGLTWLTGAWVGINLFFVLSAFLITRQLVEERVRTGAVEPDFLCRVATLTRHSGWRPQCLRASS